MKRSPNHETVPIRDVPVNKKHCRTCPFLDTGWTDVREFLVHRALKEATPICHSTGDDALVPSQGPERLCRGARNLQLRLFYRIGFLETPTDEAWDAKRKELGV